MLLLDEKRIFACRYKSLDFSLHINMVLIFIKINPKSSEIRWKKRVQKAQWVWSPQLYQLKEHIKLMACHLYYKSYDNLSSKKLKWLFCWLCCTVRTALTQTTNLTINVIKERHAVCHRCLPCHYSTVDNWKKYGACTALFFQAFKLKVAFILIFHKLKIKRGFFYMFANSISGLSVSWDSFFLLLKLIWFLMGEKLLRIMRFLFLICKEDAQRESCISRFSVRHLLRWVER